MSKQEKEAGTSVVNWQERLAKEAKAVAQTERPAISRISLRGGAMTYQNQPIPNNELTCIILANVHENAYYPNRFDPNKIEAPDCFAFSETGQDMVPHEKSYKKQDERCAICLQYQWGSDINSPSRKGKACKQKRKLLIMPGDALKNETIRTCELAILDLPTTSVKNFSSYVQGLSVGEGRPTWAMMSKIKLSPDPRTQIRVDFTAAFPLGEEHLGAILQRADEAKMVLMTPYEKTEQGLSDKTAAMQSGKKY
jgi:hypothetical protein